MTVRKVGPSSVYVIDEFIGLSTDVKPLKDVEAGSTFYELDTQNSFIFDGAKWWPA
jgi:hypothetical protein